MLDQQERDGAADHLTWPGPGAVLIQKAYIGQAPQDVEGQEDGDWG